MSMHLDDTDRRLLSFLQANAREPAATLARKLKLARTTVVARLARLERDGVVAGYGVRLGQRLDSAAVRAYCSLSILPKTAASVLKALALMPEIEEVSAVSGQFDYLVFLRCETHEQLNTLLDRIGLIEGVNHTQTSIVLSRKIDRRSAVGLSQT
jgi:DNA-binding Lrp family transcriptional regulator